MPRYNIPKHHPELATPKFRFNTPSIRIGAVDRARGTVEFIHQTPSGVAETYKVTARHPFLIWPIFSKGNIEVLAAPASTGGYKPVPGEVPEPVVKAIHELFPAPAFKHVEEVKTHRPTRSVRLLFER